MSSFGQCFANKYGLKRNGKKHAEMWRYVFAIWKSQNGKKYRGLRINWVYVHFSTKVRFHHKSILGSPRSVFHMHWSMYIHTVWNHRHYHNVCWVLTVSTFHQKCNSTIKNILESTWSMFHMHWSMYIHTVGANAITTWFYLQMHHSFMSYGSIAILSILSPGSRSHDQVYNMAEQSRHVTKRKRKSQNKTWRSK
jgi:hypothetical protein